MTGHSNHHDSVLGGSDEPPNSPHPTEAQTGIIYPEDYDVVQSDECEQGPQQVHDGVAYPANYGAAGSLHDQFTAATRVGALAVQNENVLPLDMSVMVSPQLSSTQADHPRYDVDAPLRPVSGSKIWSTLVRDSLPELAINTAGTVRQPPIGTGSRNANASAVPLPNSDGSSINNTASGSIPIALGPVVVENAAQYVARSASEETFEDADLLTPEPQMDSPPDTPVLNGVAAVPITAAAPFAGVPVLANGLTADQLVDHIKSGGLAEPGDDVLWVFQKSEKLPIRNAKISVVFHTHEPRLVSAAERVNRAANLSKFRYDSFQSRQSDVDLLNGDTYPLTEIDKRRYPHDMDFRGDVWEQETSKDCFYNIDSSDSTLVETFPEAGEALRYFNPEYFQMPYGARVVNIKIEDLDTLLFAIETGNFSNQLRVNERIMELWQEQTQTGIHYPIYYLFSISGTKQYCAMAEMIGPIRLDESIIGWPKGGCQGVIRLRFIYVKNVPFTDFANVINTHSTGHSVTNMWNGMLMASDDGRTALALYVKHPFCRNVLLFPPVEGPVPHYPERSSVGIFTYNRHAAVGKHGQLLRCIKQDQLKGEEERDDDLFYSKTLESPTNKGKKAGSNVEQKALAQIESITDAIIRGAKRGRIAAAAAAAAAKKAATALKLTTSPVIKDDQAIEQPNSEALAVNDTSVEAQPTTSHDEDTSTSTSTVPEPALESVTKSVDVSGNATTTATGVDRPASQDSAPSVRLSLSSGTTTSLIPPPPVGTNYLLKSSAAHGPPKELLPGLPSYLPPYTLKPVPRPEVPPSYHNVSREVGRFDHNNTGAPQHHPGHAGNAHGANPHGNRFGPQGSLQPTGVPTLHNTDHGGRTQPSQSRMLNYFRSPAYSMKHGRGMHDPRAMHNVDMNAGGYPAPRLLGIDPLHGAPRAMHNVDMNAGDYPAPRLGINPLRGAKTWDATSVQKFRIISGTHTQPPHGRRPPVADDVLANRRPVIPQEPPNAPSQSQIPVVQRQGAEHESVRAPLAQTEPSHMLQPSTDIFDDDDFVPSHHVHAHRIMREDNVVKNAGNENLAPTRFVAPLGPQQVITNASRPVVPNMHFLTIPEQRIYYGLQVRLVEVQEQMCTILTRAAHRAGASGRHASVSDRSNLEGGANR